jgi:hypothetical protein
MALTLTLFGSADYGFRFPIPHSAAPSPATVLQPYRNGIICVISPLSWFPFGSHLTHHRAGFYLLAPPCLPPQERLNQIICQHFCDF